MGSDGRGAGATNLNFRRGYPKKGKKAAGVGRKKLGEGKGAEPPRVEDSDPPVLPQSL